MKIVCLHGFLGLASDWDFLGPALERRGFAIRVLALDLWAHVPDSFNSLAARVAAQCDDDDVLLGYSMGGRLSTSAFFYEGGCSSGGLIVVSAHHGGLDPSQKDDRVARAFYWADKFETEPWDTLLKEWSAQPVFENDGPNPLVRRAEKFDRSRLAHGLRAWQVEHQKDARIGMANCRRPVLWMAGEHDEKYAAVTRDVAGLGQRTGTRIVKGVGHRLPWNAQEHFIDSIEAFLTEHWGHRFSK